MSTVSELAHRERTRSHLRKRRSTRTVSHERPQQQPTTASPKDNLIQVEKAETGRVKTVVYFEYLRSMSIALSAAFLIGMTATTALTMGRSFWLTAWSNDGVVVPGRNATPVSPVAVRLGVYALLGFSEVAMTGVATIAMVYGGIVASKNLHHPLIHNLMRSPMSFFDTTPLGRILNRIGKDIETIDLLLPMNFRFFVYCLLQVLSTIIIIMISTPIFGVVIIPLAVVYAFALKYYLSTSRQLKRLESITRSPIYSHFGESIQGAPSIRAYGLRAYFSTMNEEKVDTHIRCKYLNLVANRWLSVRLESVGNLVVFFASLFAVLSREFGGVISPGTVGLSITYSMNTTFVLNFAVRMISELETNIVAVERVKEYSETPTEAAWESTAGFEPPPSWPSSGRVTFDNYSTRYRRGLDLVLHKLCAQISPKERVGIVGRTGAGKSSMALSLFRIIEASDGQILIDDVDISTVGLHDLRSKLTIIPQDPVLFSGTLRVNLDPFETYSDADVWAALEHAHLKQFVSDQPKKLNHPISEGGENLSVGQRQLVCLARALLRKSKVLVLDEATAAVDVTTDALIQTTIREEFTDCTVITVAHRLNTILDYDRIMVLDHGKIREFDSPQTLLADKTSVFHSMAKDANLVSW